jgi:4-amino-4-deoxychorismate lyase
MDSPVFIEVIKAADGVYLNLEAHAVRMDRTMRRHFREAFHHPSLPKALPAPPPRGVSMLTLLYGREIISMEFSDYARPSLDSMAMVDAGQVDFPFKSRDRGRLDAIREFAGADEAVIVRNGFITNATSANLVFRDFHGGLFTPLHYIHSGTKRESYIRNKTVTAYPIKHDQLASYETVTLVNAMLDIEDGVSFECSRIKPLVTMPLPGASAADPATGDPEAAGGSPGGSSGWAPGDPAPET